MDASKDIKMGGRKWKGVRAAPSRKERKGIFRMEGGESCTIKEGAERDL
jgi:hypothetical protein